jgi:hypothetical protein
MKAGPFKVDDEHESVIRLAKKSATANVLEKSTSLLDRVINVFVGD